MLCMTKANNLQVSTQLATSDFTLDELDPDRGLKRFQRSWIFQQFEKPQKGWHEPSQKRFEMRQQRYKLGYVLVSRTVIAFVISYRFLNPFPFSNQPFFNGLNITLLS